jgi:hypothetical protein
VLKALLLVLSVVMMAFESGVSPRAYQTRASRAVPQIHRCPRGTVDNYLLPKWQQCWLEASHGRWRTVNHELHYDVLVVEVEAASLADADEIAGRFVKLHGERFPLEVLIYVRQEAAPPGATVRRVAWSKRSGFTSLEF